MPRKPALSTKQSEEILGRLQRGESCRRLASDYHVSAMTISRLAQRLHSQTKFSTHLQLPYMPPITATHGSLAVVVADPREWHVNAIMERYDELHAGACKWFKHMERHLRLQGYKHLFLWSDEQGSPALANMIQHKTGAQGQRVYARKCKVTQVDRVVANKFYKQHHLQGSCTGKVTYALEHQDQLVACMTFTDSAACRGLTGHHLLQRFACSCSVPGGASRLLKAFRDDYAGPILSYSDERYAPGGQLYRTLGFQQHKLHSPDYRYWRKSRWYAKNQKQRRHLIAEGANPALTEADMAHSLGYLRCYDLGKRTWVLE